MAVRHIAVLVPAHNEELLLARCLHSIQRSRLQLPSHVTSDVIVVSDLSEDATVQIAKSILGDDGYVGQLSARSVGMARSMAALLALQRYSGPSSTCWLANTDADCQVPESWLTHQLALAAKGARAVAGIVDVDSFSEHADHVEARFRRSYVIHPDGSHPHVHGANIGVRADAYLLAGGWTPLTTAEDHDLWQRIKKLGVQHRSDARLLVRTSGRRVGRAPSGFAAALNAHNEVSL